jgi:hypothetical protein
LGYPNGDNAIGNGALSGWFGRIRTTANQYRIYLQQVRAGTLELTNYDFDTGQESIAAEYPLTDESYAKLLGRLVERKFVLTSPKLRNNILNFYGDLTLPFETKKDSGRWQDVLTSLDQLKAFTSAPIAATSPAD